MRFSLVAQIAVSEILNSTVSTLFLFFPESKVFLKEFNDALCVSEIFFTDVVNFLESLLKGFICKLACLLVILQNLVVEN